MKTAEIRTTYLEFFRERGHTVHPSASLVPENDPSILFTGAGMNQFKDMFLGRGNLAFRRATTAQKCLRVPDLEEVGRTPSHHTFFEMLGNFSFGDYFKEEAIAWADELLREGFGLERKHLAISVYQDDAEAAAIWQKVGYPRERIFRYGERDNFWPAEAPSKGPNGPCGPCSEIYFDFGAKHPGASDPASNGQRFVEIWNLVFTQFDRQEGGALQPLPQKNIDTGMGLERLARVLQGVPTNFDTDAFAAILAKLAQLSGRPYGQDPSRDQAMRRIADHVRAVVFCISDGVVPSNERQGYVVRKILRRAVADGWDALGLEGPFLEALAPAVYETPGLATFYPNLTRHRPKILGVIGEEERKFLETYSRGRALLEEELQKVQASGGRTLPGKVAFFLWDTAGFPLDLTRRLLEDRQWTLDEAGFERAMEEQRSKSRAASNIKAEIFSAGPLANLRPRLPATRFLGYETCETPQPIGAILVGEELVAVAHEGQSVALIFAETPFYAESGGQVGDRGEWISDAARVRILDTVRVEGYHLHQGTVTAGQIHAGDRGRLVVDAAHRAPTMRNHTATHLLHWALRKVLGPGVEQKGSLVEASRLRFDFSNAGPVPVEKLREVERLVNEEILRNATVRKDERTYEQALQEGAIALFGEKYGDLVRVVKVEGTPARDTSVELCGGTHVDRTGDIGAFRIVSETGISAGVRRIEAVTGLGVLQVAQRQEDLLREIGQALRVSPEDAPARLQGLLSELRKLKKSGGGSRQGPGSGLLERVLAERTAIDGLSAFVTAVDGSADELAQVCDALKSRVREPLCAVLIGKESGGGLAVVVGANKEAQSRGIHAGQLCKKTATLLGGGGGGNPAFARGQGRQPEAIPAALEGALSELRAALAAGH